MNCSPANLIQESADYQRIPSSRIQSVVSHLLCEWANAGSGPPPVPPSTLLNGLMAYFPIDVNDSGKTSARAYLETRESSLPDPANGFVNPVASAGAGFPNATIQGQIYPCLATGELTGECYIFTGVACSPPNNQITWGAWPAAQGPVLYITKFSGTYWYQLVPKATVNAGWVDNNSGYVNVAASTVADYPEIIKRLYYRATQLARPTALPLVPGYLDANSAVTLASNPYLLLQPSFEFLTQDYTYAWVGQIKGTNYYLAHRSPTIERWQSVVTGAPGLTATITCSHSTLAAPNTAGLAIDPTTGANDWFLIVCRYSTAEVAMSLDAYDLTNGTYDFNHASPCNPPRIVGSYAMTDLLETVLALGGSYHFNVRGSTVVDKFYCWNRKLTDLEVAELYNAGLLWEPEKPL